MKQSTAIDLLTWYRAAPIEQVAVTLETIDLKTWWLNVTGQDDHTLQFNDIESFIVTIRGLRGPQGSQA